MKIFNVESAIENMNRVIENRIIDYKDLPPFYTIMHHVSRSGMSRDIELFWLLNNVKVFLGEGRVNGCGMDMGFHIALTVFESWKRNNDMNYGDLRYQEFFDHRWF